MDDHPWNRILRRSLQSVVRNDQSRYGSENFGAVSLWVWVNAEKLWSMKFQIWSAIRDHPWILISWMIIHEFAHMRMSGSGGKSGRSDISLVLQVPSGHSLRICWRKSGDLRASAVCLASGWCWLQIVSKNVHVFLRALDLRNGWEFQIHHKHF